MLHSIHCTPIHYTEPVHCYTMSKMNPPDYLLALRSNNHSSYSMFTFTHSLTIYSVGISPSSHYSDPPPHFKSCSTTCLFTNRGNISSSSFTPRLHTSYPLRLPDRKILWAHRSFICSIVASGRDMRDLRLCTLLRYDELSMKKKIWENGWESGGFEQISLPRLSSSSDHSSAHFFLSCSPSSCTHILCGHTSSYETVDMTRVFLVQCLKCLIHALCLIRVSSFHMLFCLFHFTKYLFINVFLPHSAPQILTLGSKLTWAPSAIFRLSTSLYVGAGNSRDVPTVHSTHFL